MTPAGQRLHDFLTAAIDGQKRGLVMANIGGKRMAAELVGGIKSAVAQAMDESKLQIAGAITELVSEIRDGTKQVVRAVNSETMAVRGEFGDIIGNAETAANDAIDTVKKIASETSTEKSGGG